MIRIVSFISNPLGKLIAVKSGFSFRTLSGNTTKLFFRKIEFLVNSLEYSLSFFQLEYCFQSPQQKACNYIHYNRELLTYC